MVLFSGLRYIDDSAPRGCKDKARDNKQHQDDGDALFHDEPSIGLLNNVYQYAKRAVNSLECKNSLKKLISQNLHN